MAPSFSLVSTPCSRMKRRCGFAAALLAAAPASYGGGGVFGVRGECDGALETDEGGGLYSLSLGTERHGRTRRCRGSSGELGMGEALGRCGGVRRVSCACWRGEARCVMRCELDNVHVKGL